MIKETSGERTELYYRKATKMLAGKAGDNEALIGGIICAMHLEDQNETLGEILQKMNERITSGIDKLKTAIEESPPGGS